MKVVKFGGSSLASATQFKKVHDIVLEDTDRHYVVPSAPGKRNKEDTKVTDLLILAYSHHNKDDFEEIYDRIKERYNEIITELGLDVSLEEDFKEIKEEIKKQNSFDYTISRGEYLNGKVLANYLGFDFIDAADVSILINMVDMMKREQMQLSQKLYLNMIMQLFQDSMDS